MSSVDVLPIMHMFTHPKNSAGLITYDSTGYRLIRCSFKEPIAQGFQKSRSFAQAVPADCRLQVLVRTRLRPDSARIDECRLSANLQPSLCPSVVLDTLFPHLEVVHVVVDVFWH